MTIQTPSGSRLRRFTHGARRVFTAAAPATLTALALLCTQTSGRAQGVYGSIVGTISDSTGAVIPNATIVVTDVSKGTTQTVQSNGSGEYTVGRLIPDTYSVKATSGSFKPAEADNVVVSTDTSPQINLTMSATSTATNVTVTTAAPILKTDETDVSQTLNAQQLQTVPNVNRNFSQFTLLTPGVQRGSFSISPTENPQGTVSTEINGTNYGAEGFLLDGTDDREPIDGIIVINPTLDSIQDMHVISENYPAEFGGAVGGFITGSTKSGGNEIHGDAFEFRRSDAQEARDPFLQYSPDPVTGKYIPSSLYNQFGGSIGGPILKNHAFYFLDYQGTRQRVGTSLRENVPTALVRSTCLSGAGPCNLSQYGVATVTQHPASGDVGNTYSSSAIPASAITPQAIALLSALPAPNTGAAGATVDNYAGSGNGQNNGDEADLRLDDQLSQKTHAFGRYDYANFRLVGVPVFGAAGGTGFGIGNTTGYDSAQNQSVALGVDYALSSSLLTDARFGFLAYHIVNSKYDTGTAPATADGIATLNTTAGDTSGSPTYNVEDGSISNFGEQGCNCPLTESEQVFQLANNWTKTLGNHSIKFGIDLRYALNLRDASDSNRAGQLSFGQGATGLGLASVLFGEVDTFQRFDVYDQSAASRQKRGGFYVQDDWRFTPKLTLNYGVRWDIVFPETVNTPGAGGLTDLNTGFVQVAGYGPYGTNGGASVDLKDLGGRFGFAYQVRPDTVLRGAFGQMYDNVGFFGTIFGTALTENLPTVNSEDVTTSNDPGVYSFNFDNLPAKPAPFVIPASGAIPIPQGVGVPVRPNKLILPEVYQYNLSLQQQLSNNLTATIAYVGNVADRIYPSETEGYDINEQVLPAPTTDPGTQALELSETNERRPYYNRFTNIYQGAVVQCCSQPLNSTAPAARAVYNSLEATLQQRYANGFQFLANYTWSRALNYGATYFAQNKNVEYGPNDTNRTNNFVLSGLYDLPFGHGKKFVNSSNRLTNYAVGGWELAGTTTWESGLPFTPTYGECASDQDVDTNYQTPGTSSDCRPDKTSGSSAFPLSAGGYNTTTHARRYFTPVAPLGAAGSSSGPFVRPAFGTIGNIGRDSFRGPSDYFADASLFKNFTVTERVHGQFQFQAFNVFNHVPLGLPSATNARCVDCATGDEGQITTVDSAVYGTGLPYMRQLQFGARLQF
jgi:hypothetical protein